MGFGSEASKVSKLKQMILDGHMLSDEKYLMGDERQKIGLLEGCKVNYAAYQHLSRKQRDLVLTAAAVLITLKHEIPWRIKSTDNLRVLCEDLGLILQLVRMENLRELRSVLKRAVEDLQWIAALL